ncbi:MAG: zf-HC2 domain-containing protein [Phycisphaeraceae bacterium]|nr:zf-HC2 domain-containing protein [Phycisphaeraceae bacterium]
MSEPTPRQAPATGSGITCREAIDFIMAYLDNELPLEQRHEFERHLSVCPSCVNYLDSYQRTVTLGRETHRGNTDDVPASLLKAIGAARKRSGSA